MVLVEFLSTFLLGLVTGVSFSHLLQRGPKKTLPAAQFLAVQQVLLRNYGRAIGGLEVASLFLTLRRTGRTCATGGTFFTRSDFSFLPSPLARSSAHYSYERKVPGLFSGPP